MSEIEEMGFVGIQENRNLETGFSGFLGTKNKYTKMDSELMEDAVHLQQERSRSTKKYGYEAEGKSLEEIRVTVSIYMKAKKTKYGGRDRFMELPEEILHHILSYLPMKDVIKTSVLAKRWRYVWSYVPCLNFPPTETTAKRKLAFINRSLLLHKSLEIHKLSISFGKKLQQADSGSVESWIMFAAKRNVKDLRLIFSGFNQVLPRCVFKCGSLTILELRKCTIETPAAFRLGSLKSVSLEDISRGYEHASALLAASPNVECLSLINCARSGSEKIDLFIMNLSLKTLKIKETDCFSGNRTMNFHAPFVINLDLFVRMCKGKCVLTKMESLQSVILSCPEFDWLRPEEDRGKTYPLLGVHVNTFEKILDNVCHVKDLTLSRNYIRAISTIEEEMEGSLTFNCTNLELKTRLAKDEIAAIVFILKLSPNVQTLIISIEETTMKKRSELPPMIPEGEDEISQKMEITDMLKNLVTIKVNDFMKNCFVPRKGKHTTTEEMASQLEDNLSFLKFLLQNSPALKSMTIGLTKHLNLDQSKMMQLQLLIHERLQAFRRGSRDAVVSFRGN